MTIKRLIQTDSPEAFIEEIEKILEKAKKYYKEKEML